MAPTPKQLCCFGSNRQWLMLSVSLLMIEGMISCIYLISATGPVSERLISLGMMDPGARQSVAQMELRVQLVLALIHFLVTVLYIVWPILAEAQAQKRPSFLVPYALLMMISIITNAVLFVGAAAAGGSLIAFGAFCYLAFYIATMVVTIYRYDEIKAENRVVGLEECGGTRGVPVMFVNK